MEPKNDDSKFIADLTILILWILCIIAYLVALHFLAIRKGYEGGLIGVFRALQQLRQQ